jgi:hypothetical protein
MPGSTIKKENFDLSKIDQNSLNGNLSISMLVSKIIKQLNGQPTSAQGNQTSASVTGQRAHNYSCVFCSEMGHFLKGHMGNLDGCATALKYIQKGLCEAGENGQIVLPSGERIYAQGKDIKERLDNWHKTNKLAMSTNFVGATEVNATAGFVWTKAEAKDLPQVTQRKIEGLEMLESLVTLTQKKIDSMKHRMGGQARSSGPTMRSWQEAEKKAQQQEKQAEPSTHTSEPQFWYVMPIEDLDLVKNISKRTLEIPVTVSARELLSLVPDVWKQVKEMLTTKWVPQSATTAFMEEGQVVKLADVFMARLAS